MIFELKLKEIFLLRHDESEIFKAIDSLRETFRVVEGERARGKEDMQFRRGKASQMSAGSNPEVANATSKLGAGGGGGEEYI